MRIMGNNTYKTAQHLAHTSHSINITYNHQRGTDSKQYFPNLFNLFSPGGFRIPYNLRHVLKHTHTNQTLSKSMFGTYYLKCNTISNQYLRRHLGIIWETKGKKFCLFCFSFFPNEKEYITQQNTLEQNLYSFLI